MNLRIFFILLIAISSRAYGQAQEVYKPVNIDSILQEKAILPDGKTLVIRNIKFTAIYYGEIHRDGGAMEFTVKRDSPRLNINFSGTGALFKHGDSIFSATLARKSLLKLLKPFEKIKRTAVNAKMIIFRVKKDDTRRGFLVEDIKTTED